MLHDSHTIRCEEEYYQSNYTNGTSKTPSLVFPSRRRGVELEEIFIRFIWYSFFGGRDMERLTFEYSVP